jgi:hypothetical protein
MQMGDFCLTGVSESINGKEGEVIWFQARDELK